VNEWDAAWNSRQPGAIVGYLSSLAYAGVDVANMACWGTSLSGQERSTCFARPGMLDGLLLDDGTTPTDAWFVHTAYAQMTGGGATLLGSSIADPEASIVATVDPAGTIRVLLGRHTGCQAGVDEACPTSMSYAAPKQVHGILTVGTGAQTYSATVGKIPSVKAALQAPQALSTGTLAVSGGKLDLGTWSVGDGEAIVITLVRS
jgi:hypothetical protein